MIERARVATKMDGEFVLSAHGGPWPRQCHRCCANLANTQSWVVSAETMVRPHDHPRAVLAIVRTSRRILSKPRREASPCLGGIQQAKSALMRAGEEVVTD